MHALSGIPEHVVGELQQRSGLKSLPIVDASTSPKEAAALFHEHGILAIRGALPDEVLLPLKAKCTQVMNEIIRHDIDGLGSRGPKRYSFGGSSSTGSQLHHAEWGALVDVPPVTAVLDAIWDSQDYACHTAGGDFCLSGAPGHQNLHADAWSLGCEQFPVARLIAVNYLVEDQTPLNGPLRLVPGTHRRDVRLAPKVREEPEEYIFSTVCPLPAGTALVRDLRTWHGGTPNLSTSHRPMPNAEFMSPSMLQRVQEIDKAMPYEIWKGLSERGRHLAQYLKADEGESVHACVQFDIPLGGSVGTRNFFNGFELAPSFDECRAALPLPTSPPSRNRCSDS